MEEVRGVAGRSVGTHPARETPPMVFVTREGVDSFFGDLISVYTPLPVHQTAW